MKTTSFSVLLAGFLVVGLAACTSEQIVQGECQSVYDGDICTWGKMLGDHVVEFGATVPLTFVENVPMEGEMVFPPVALARIAMPSEIASKTGINHLAINWEMHGHPPGPFLTPHFDFHFNTVSGEAIEAIDCSDTSKPDVLPTGYVMPDEEIPGLGTLIGLCVPDMGMHALSAAEASAEGLFDATMIVGYYSQNVIFVEPMIAQAALLAGDNFTLSVPAVADAGANVIWPSSFEAVYDAEARSYQFVFKMPTTP